MIEQHIKGLILFRIYIAKMRTALEIQRSCDRLVNTSGKQEIIKLADQIQTRKPKKLTVETAVERVIMEDIKQGIRKILY